MYSARSAAARLVAALAFAGLTGCTPPWSLKLHEPAADHRRFVLRDARPADAKAFHFEGAMTYRSHLADSNTTPDRMTVLQLRLDASKLPDTTTPIVVTQFDILQDLGSAAPAGVAVVGGTPVVAATRGGDNSIECTLTASFNGVEHAVATKASYTPGAFDGPAAEPKTGAAQRCIDELIDIWIAQAGA